MKKSYLVLSVILLIGVIADAQPKTINTIAGDGMPGFAGDGTPATGAKIDTMGFVAVDDSDNIYIADAQNNRIRKVFHTTGFIKTIAGNGKAGWTGDHSAAIYAELYYPLGIALDTADNVYFTDNGNGCVRKITKANGIITTIAGTGNSGNTGNDSAATNATFEDPTGIAVDKLGNVYIADAGSNCIRRILASDSDIYLFAGNGAAGYSGDGGAAIDAELNQPLGIALDPSGNLYIADWQNLVIREVNRAGEMLTSAGIYNNDSYNSSSGPANAIALSSPTDVACDKYGNVFVADAGDNVVREIIVGTSNYDTVMAGDTGQGFMGDGGAAIDAELNYPFGVCVDASSNIFIGDLLNFRIRVVGTYVTGLTPISAPDAFTVYPNPVTTILNIGFPASFNTGYNTIEIMDITGRTIISFDRNIKPNAILPVDVSTLSIGMYFIRVANSDNDASSQVVKFIKE